MRGARLVSALADAGAVLLPFSYSSGVTVHLGGGLTFQVGAGLEPAAGGAVMHVASFDETQSKESLTEAAMLLDGELTTIHTVWPDTHVCPDWPQLRRPCRRGLVAGGVVVGIAG